MIKETEKYKRYGVVPTNRKTRKKNNNYLGRLTNALTARPVHIELGQKRPCVRYHST
jgi:hypothetical protein